MNETPEQRVARLEAELAVAKVEALQKQLAQAQGQAGKSPQMTRHSFVGRPPVHLAKHVHAPADTHLAPAPRAVPFSYRAIVLPFSWWAVFILFMIAVSPIALWIAVPIAGFAVALGTFLIVAFLLLRRSARRSALLKWGEVANVVSTDLESRGTYYSGTTVQNVRIPQAHGWEVERKWYSGPVSKTKVEYELHGTRGEITIRGLDYAGGVILADSRDPRRALCVSSFPYDLKRDPSGNWTGEVATRVKVGALVMLFILIDWTVAMCLICGNAAGLFDGLLN